MLLHIVGVYHGHGSVLRCTRAGLDWTILGWLRLVADCCLAFVAIFVLIFHNIVYGGRRRNLLNVLGGTEQFSLNAAMYRFFPN